MADLAMAARPALPSLLLLLLLLISAVDLVSSDIAPSPVPGGPVRAPILPTPLPSSAAVPSPSSPAPAFGPSPSSPAATLGTSPSSPTAALGTSPSSPAPALGTSAPSPAFSPGNSESPPAAPVAPASSPSPTPAPSAVNEVVADGKKNDEQAVVGDSSGGMSRGKKAGIAVGVLAAAAVVGLGALVYKKRRENIQRSRYGYATRRDML